MNNLKKTRNDELDDDDEVFTEGRGSLGYFERCMPIRNITVPIDGPILDASYYRTVVDKIESLSEHDTVKFRINSPGGDLRGLVALLNAIHTTEATVIAQVEGECHSAASMLALNCQNIIISPLSNMLCHFVSFGTGGKAQDIKSHVQHITSYSEKLFKETYEHFLTEEEQREIIEGKELWLQSDDIEARLVKRQEILNKATETMLQEQLIDLEQQIEEAKELESKVSKPKRKPKAKPSE